MFWWYFDRDGASFAIGEIFKIIYIIYAIYITLGKFASAYIVNNYDNFVAYQDRSLSLFIKCRYCAARLNSRKAIVITINCISEIFNYNNLLARGKK